VRCPPSSSGTAVGEALNILENADLKGLSRTQALHDYLSLTYVPAPATIFRAARKLPAGTMLVAENGAVKIERYWDLRLDTALPIKREEEYVEALLSPGVYNSA